MVPTRFPVDFHNGAACNLGCHLFLSRGAHQIRTMSTIAVSANFIPIDITFIDILLWEDDMG
jgi:hypothetical protein